MRLKFLLLVGGLLLSFSMQAQDKKYQPHWKSIDSRPVPQWFNDAKFGIFIHWGVYSVPAWAPVDKTLAVGAKYSEWYWYRLNHDKDKVGEAFQKFHKEKYNNAPYQDFVKDLKAELFNPDQWADVIASSGAKYVVLTSKHHDGFALWPSQHSWNWNSVDVGPHKDVAGDLSKAVKAKGLHMGFYYSLYEWFNPIYLTDVNRYVSDHMIPQMKDLITRYQPDVLWADGEWEHPSETWRSAEFLAWLYNDSPVKDRIVVNDRWGKETRGKHGGYYTTEYDLVHEANSKNVKITHPWEEIRGMGNSFGFNRNENLEDYSSSEQLVHVLIEKVAKGGTLLLDIGPDADGTIPVIMQQRLTDMGAWLKVNGNAIYGTSSWANAPAYNDDTQIYYTCKNKDLYVICNKYPKGEITVNNVNKPTAVKMLGVNGNSQAVFKNRSVTISAPTLDPVTNPCQYAWVFKLENAL